MKTQRQWRNFLPLLMGSIAVILFSTAGIAAILGWRPILTGSSGSGIAHDSAGQSTIAAALNAQAAQRRAKTRANGRCIECGQVVAMGQIAGLDDEAGIGAASWATDENAGEQRLNSATRHEMVVRMADGSSRVINSASPAGWRIGERVIVISGTTSPQR